MESLGAFQSLPRGKSWNWFLESLLIAQERGGHSRKKKQGLEGGATK